MDNNSDKWNVVRHIINPKPIITTNLSDKFINVLTEFKNVLNESPYMRAFLRVKSQDTNPQIWALNTRPRYRPSEGSIIFNIAVYYDFVRILGEENEITTPDELFTRLSHFVTDSFFPSTVANYQSRFNEDVAGALQMIKHNGPTTKDTIVVLPWSEHNRLGEIAENGGGTAKLKAKVEHMQGFPEYDKENKYRFLCSMGYFLEISEFYQMNEDYIEILGQVEAYIERSDEIEESTIKAIQNTPPLTRHSDVKPVGYEERRKDRNDERPRRHGVKSAGHSVRSIDNKDEGRHHGERPAGYMGRRKNRNDERPRRHGVKSVGYGVHSNDNKDEGQHHGERPAGYMGRRKKNRKVEYSRRIKK